MLRLDTEKAILLLWKDSNEHGGNAFNLVSPMSSIWYLLHDYKVSLKMARSKNFRHNGQHLNVQILGIEKSQVPPNSIWLAKAWETVTSLPSMAEWVCTNWNKTCYLWCGTERQDSREGICFTCGRPAFNPWHLIWCPEHRQEWIPECIANLISGVSTEHHWVCPLHPQNKNNKNMLLMVEEAGKWLWTNSQLTPPLLSN